MRFDQAASVNHGLLAEALDDLTRGLRQPGCGHGAGAPGQCDALAGVRGEGGHM